MPLMPVNLFPSALTFTFFAHCYSIINSVVMNREACVLIWLRTTDKWAIEEYVLSSVTGRLTSVSFPQTVHLVLRPDLGGFCLFSYAPRQPVLQNSWKDSLESTWATMVPFMFVMSLKNTNTSHSTHSRASRENFTSVCKKKKVIAGFVFKYCDSDLQRYELKY